MGKSLYMDMANLMDNNTRGITKIKTIKPPSEGDLALRPCPFCGSSDVVYMAYEYAGTTRYAVVCCGCVATIDPGWAVLRSQVAEKWNRRTTQ